MPKQIVSINEICGVSPLQPIHLNKYLSIPSHVHGYSLAIEFTRNWILSVFPEDFFKTVHIGGKHVYADYRKFNREIRQEIVKPALAILPSLNPDYNRDNVDLIQGGLDLFSRRSKYFDERFFIDDNKNAHIGMHLKQIEMPFQIRMRVRSRAQQLDLYEFTKVGCRIGSTQSHFIDMDCQVPYDIIISLALDTGFEVFKDKDDNYKIKNVVGFLNYLNSKSKVPFIYKMRAINGKCEFFIRLKKCYVHVSCLDGITIDEGEKQGMLDANYHIDFSALVKFSVPAFYVYYSTNEHRILDQELGKINSMYQIISVKPPETNELGWGQYLTTQWIEDSYYLYEIPFSELLENAEIQRVITHNIETGISPALFMDIKIWNGQREIPIYIDWENYNIIIHKDVKEEDSDIAIYADLAYINNTLANLDNMNSNRMITDLKSE